jgi:hypothetical protein
MTRKVCGACSIKTTDTDSGRPLRWRGYTHLHYTERLITLISSRVSNNLKATSRKAKVSVAEVVRQAIAEYLAKEEAK